ncbi:hypothetical protein [Methylotuvimicrobium sp.]|uniref:hypothetical protein n=1 Tax=Methylotuvimicrobium sp. TaxID=2822413 RepID=UPI003D65400F
MNKLKFRMQPNLTNEAMPFAPDEQSFAKWLDLLSSKNGYEICRELTSAFHVMNSMDISPRFRFICLYQAMPLVNEVAEKLESVYLDSGFPLSEEETSNVEILVWVYTQLTMNFSDLSHQLESIDSNWSKQEQAQILFSAMYAASQVLLHISQVYASVQKGFWLNCYRNYIRAETLGLLNIPVNMSHVKHTTIASIFKQMLIFSCCDTDCFRVREMNTLFNLLEECVETISLNNAIELEAIQGVFQLNLDVDEAPTKCLQFQAEPQNNTRYIATLPVVNNLIIAAQKRKDKKSNYRFIDKDLLFRVAEVLTKKRTRKYTRIVSTENARGYIGFKSIVSMLAQIQGVDNETIKVKFEHDPRIAGSWQVPDLDLVPEGDEIAYNLNQKKSGHLAIDPKAAKIHKLGALASSGNKIWSQPETIELLNKIPFGDFLILNSSIKGYALIWNSEDQRIKVGELFAVQQPEFNELEIGQIRRISRLEDEDLILGIELMGMRSELVWIILLDINKQQGQMAIYIPADSILHQPESIVVDTHCLKPGQTIQVHREKHRTLYRTGKILHVTAALQHIELVAINEGCN